MINPAFEAESNDINTDVSYITDYIADQQSSFKDINSDSKKFHLNEISMPTECKIDQFNDNHVYDDNELSNDAQGEKFEELDDINTVQQIQTNMAVPSGVAEMIQRTSVYLRRFFHKSEKPKKSQVHRLKLCEIYRFADKLDVFLMIIGTIAAIIAGALLPLMLYLYERVLDSLVDMERLQTIVNASIFMNNSFGECFVVPGNNTETQSPYDAIVGMINYFALLGSLSILCYWIAWASWIIAAERQVRRIRYALFRNILRQEIGWFDVHNTGELSNRLIRDLDTIKDGINDNMADLITLLARILSTLIYILVIGWKLTLVSLSLLPLMIFAFKMIIKTTVNYTSKEIQAFASASSISQEVLQNVRTVTTFHGQAKEEERFAKNLIVAKNIGIKKALYVGIWLGLAYICAYVSHTLTFWYGSQLVRTDCTNYSAGIVMVVFMGCMYASSYTAYLTPNIQHFAEALTSGSYVFDIIDRQTKIDVSSDEGDKPQNMIGDIEFNNVTFTYPARQETPILNKLSLKILSGKTVALVGASGCGKSTIIQLIQRFYDSDEGQILLDGKDIKTLNVSWLRSHIGIVSQEPVLFTGSIEDNIRFGKLNATDDEVQTAAKKANAHDFIMEFPENYKTLSGDKLSGGQKQRVAIARALVSNPKILLLDEATSALDNTSERIVQDALDKAKQGRTTIVIAHRLSTIRNADLIIGLEHGRVIEYGIHDDLMKHKGLYYELVITQTQKEEQADLDSDQEDDKMEEEFVRQRLANCNLSKQSDIVIDDLDKNVENNEETIFDDPSKKKKERFRTSLALTILKLNAPEWLWLLLGGIFSLISGATQPLFALFLAKIFSLFVEPNLEEQKRLINIYAACTFLTGLVAAVTQLLINVGFAKSGEELTMRMRKLIFSAILRQEMSYFDYETNSSGALITRLSIDASSLKGMTGARIGTILQALSATITCLAVAFSVGWKLAFVVICFVPPILFGGIVQGRKQNNIAKSKDKSSFTEQGGQYATQAIEHIRTVVAIHQEKHFIDLYENVFNQEFKKQMCHLHLMGIGTGVANSTIYFAYMATFSYGNKLVKDGDMKFDEVIRILIAITFATITIGRAIAMIPDYSKAQQAALRILQLDQRQSEINPHDESGIILNKVIGNIEFDDVHFRYPSRPTFRILRNFSLKCSTGRTTALVGPSGSGKSTIIGLLQRFYDPLNGKVLLDGHDIKYLNLRWLRSLMGFVQQEPVLFNLSIYDNIAYGDNSRQITQDEIETAARMANIHELIISLPKGYETLCGAKGSQLSGGQKQRIAIARALIRSPKILLLDEATSSLDSKSEKVVQATLDKARSGRTCLTVAHRLSTIQNSENIVVVDRGKVKEQGTHDELLRLNGIYTQLASTQGRST
ncbi:unnamed protein product [Rotaria sordida]|uniref:Uncharacterized protein n=3 Tax=Rotaria sordida TaxID=392033 RepID=A0A815Z345_9BILA|nr:unnamed protein product [Rotaria sordida]CAF1578976.1 unnamed protein product [Rotaria sordida]